MVDVNCHAIAGKASERARSSLLTRLTLASLNAPNQYRRDLGCLSRRPTEASRWNRAPATAINNSGADLGKTKIQPQRAQKTRARGGSKEHTTRRKHQKLLRERPTRRQTAPYSNCTKEEVLQGFRRRAARTGMSQLTAAIRHAFPSSCATRNTAPHFPLATQKSTQNAGQVGACARHYFQAIAAISRKKLQPRRAHTETKQTKTRTRIIRR